MGNSKKGLRELIKTVMISYIITGIMLFVFAVILYKLELSVSKIKTGVIIVYVTVNMVGGFIIGRKKGVKKYMWGGICGFIYFMILFTVSLIVSKSVGQNTSGVLPAFAACIGGGMIGGMIS